MNAHMRAEFERLEEYKALELRHCYRQWADLEVDRYGPLKVGARLCFVLPAFSMTSNASTTNPY